MNGDRKKTQSALNEKSNVSRFFRQANSLHKELLSDIGSNLIYLDNKGNLKYQHDYLVDVKG